MRELKRLNEKLVYFLKYISDLMIFLCKCLRPVLGCCHEINLYIPSFEYSCVYYKDVMFII